MIKTVETRCVIRTRALIQTDNPDFEDELKKLINKQRKHIWNKIKTLKEDDMEKLITDIGDFP